MFGRVPGPGGWSWVTPLVRTVPATPLPRVPPPLHPGSVLAPAVHAVVMTGSPGSFWFQRLSHMTRSLGFRGATVVISGVTSGVISGVWTKESFLTVKETAFSEKCQN